MKRVEGSLYDHIGKYITYCHAIDISIVAFIRVRQGTVNKHVGLEMLEH
jgi:hypothetical protein